MGVCAIVLTQFGFPRFTETNTMQRYTFLVHYVHPFEGLGVHAEFKSENKAYRMAALLELFGFRRVRVTVWDSISKCEEEY